MAKDDQGGEPVDPLKNLSDNHVQILIALDAMDSLVDAGLRGDLRHDAFVQVVDFIEHWADGAHYEKEELLFDALIAAGIPRQMGPTAFLEMEHGASRAQGARMRDALDGLAAGHEGHRALLLDAVARYVAVVRVHLPKEEMGYFPMARGVLGGPAKERLAGEFARIDGALPRSFAAAVAALPHIPRSAPGRPVPATPVARRTPRAHLAWVVGGLTDAPLGPGSPVKVRRRR